jgi:hypothetical protein
LLVFLLEFKPCRFELREIKVREILGKKRFRLLIGFKSRHFPFHRLQSLCRAYTGPSPGV